MKELKAFVDGLSSLSKQFKEDATTTTDEYKQALKAAGDSASVSEECKKPVRAAVDEVKDVSHQYAQAMIQTAEKYVADVKQLYTDTYGSDTKPVEPEEGTPDQGNPGAKPDQGFNPNQPSQPIAGTGDKPSQGTPGNQPSQGFNPNAPDQGLPPTAAPKKGK